MLSSGAGLRRGIGGGTAVDVRGVARIAAFGIGGGCVRVEGGGGCVRVEGDRGSGGGSAGTVRCRARGDRESGWSLFESDVDIDCSPLRGDAASTSNAASP